MSLLFFPGPFAARRRARRSARAGRVNRLMVHPVLDGLESRITLSVDVWTGGAASASEDFGWSNPLNWSQGIPQSGQDLQFPIAGANNFIPTQPIVNDLTGMTFGSIEIDAPGYSLSGNAISLTAATGIFTTYTSGDSTDSIDTNLSGTDITVAAGGELDLNGVVSGTNGLVLTGGGILGGTGQVPSLEVETGQVSPGIQGAGNLTVVGRVTFDQGSTFSASLNGQGQSSSLSATGAHAPTVRLESPTLLVSLAAGFTPAPGEAFPIIQGTVSGSFAGLPEGASLSAGGTTFGISYQQGVVLTAAKAPSTTQTSVLNGTGQSVFGQSVTFTATVSAVGGTPTGSVTFEDGGSVLGTAALDASGFATFTTANLSIGENVITSVYGGDSTFSGSTSPAFDQTVTQASTSTTVSSAENPSVFGQGVTFIAEVSADSPSSATPTGGTVTFLDGTTTLGATTLSSGIARFTTSALLLGQNSISATYGGDTDFSGSNSPALDQVVGQSGTNTTLISSANPSVFGQGVTFTAQVAAALPGTGTPTGSVTFMAGSTTLGTAQLIAGIATFPTSSLAVGTPSITAVYGGDADFTASTSASVNQEVDQASTSTTLSSSPEPSYLGESVTFTASVAAVSPGAGTPTGSVTFMDGKTELGTMDLHSSIATFSASGLTVGTHSITAVYSGNADFIASTSSPSQQLVGGTTTALSSSPDPSTFGQSVTFTATVSAIAAGGGVPTGSVIFMDGTTVLGNSTLVRPSVAAISITGLSGGTHSITAVYEGNAQYVASTSSAISQVVDPASTSTTVTPSVNPSTFGQSVIFAAAVSAAVGTPTGSVTFKDGSTVLGTTSLDASGIATFSSHALAVGPHSVVAVYSGSGSYASSQSSNLALTVGQAATTTNLASSTFAPAVGQNVTFAATVAAAAPGAGAPTGVVAFHDGTTVIGTAPVSAGEALLTVAFSEAGQSHVITATYLGSESFQASASAGRAETVVQATPTIALIATPVFVGSTARGVTFRVVVQAEYSGAPVPSGSVTFRSDGRNFRTRVLAGGTASVFVATRQAVDRTFRVRYLGDADYKAGMSNRFHIRSSFFLPSFPASLRAVRG